MTSTRHEALGHQGLQWHHTSHAMTGRHDVPHGAKELWVRLKLHMKSLMKSDNYSVSSNFASAPIASALNPYPSNVLEYLVTIVILSTETPWS